MLSNISPDTVNYTEMLWYFTKQFVEYSDLPVFQYEVIRAVIFEKVLEYEPLKTLFITGFGYYIDGHYTPEDILTDICEDLKGYYHVNVGTDSIQTALLSTYEYIHNGYYETPNYYCGCGCENNY